MGRSSRGSESSQAAEQGVRELKPLLPDTLAAYVRTTPDGPKDPSTTPAQ